MTEDQGKNIKIAITVRTEPEAARLQSVTRACGFNLCQVFMNPRETLEFAKRNQFQLFITHHDFADMSGLTMIQSLRETGNYGVEPHLFLVDELTAEIMLVLNEHNIEHVLTQPFTPERLKQKLQYLWQSETHMTATEQEFREAHAAMATGLLEMAHELALRNLRSHGPSEKLLLLLGHIAAKQQQPAEARRYYEAAQKYNPLSSSAAHKLARTYMMEHNFAKAAELLNQLLRLNPLNLEILANAGLSNYELGNYTEAKDAAGRLQKLDRERKDASEILAKVAIQQSDYDCAVRLLQTTHHPNEFVQILNNEGVRLSRKNETGAAITMYLTCINTIGSHPDVYAICYNLGLAYNRRRDNASAVVWFKKALELRPDFEKAASALNKLQSKTAP